MYDQMRHVELLMMPVTLKIHFHLVKDLRHWMTGLKTGSEKQALTYGTTYLPIRWCLSRPEPEWAGAASTRSRRLTSSWTWHLWFCTSDIHHWTYSARHGYISRNYEILPWHRQDCTTHRIKWHSKTIKLAVYKEIFFRSQFSNWPLFSCLCPYLFLNVPHMFYLFQTNWTM